MATQTTQTKLTQEQNKKLLDETKKKFLQIQQQDPTLLKKRMSTIEEMRARKKEAEQITDEEERDSRLRILKADSKQIRKLNEDDETQLATVVFGVRALVADMGFNLNDLTNFTPEEEQVVTDARLELEKANAALKVAEKTWWKRATNVANAQAVIETAKQGVAAAEATKIQMQTTRVQKASLGESLQDLIRMNEICTEKLRTRKGILEGMLEETILSKDATYKEKQDKVAEATECDKAIAKLKNEIKDLDDELDNTNTNSSEHVELCDKKSKKEIELKRLETQKKAAVGRAETDQINIKAQEGDIETQQTQIGNLQCLIEISEAQTRGIYISMRNRLESMKSNAEENAKTLLSQIGNEAIVNNAQAMAEYETVSDENLAKSYESFKDTNRSLDTIRDARSEKKADVVERFKKVYEEFKRDGIDPLQNVSMEETKSGDAV